MCSRKHGKLYKKIIRHQKYLFYKRVASIKISLWYFGSIVLNVSIFQLNPYRHKLFESLRMSLIVALLVRSIIFSLACTLGTQNQDRNYLFLLPQFRSLLLGLFVILLNFYPVLPISELDLGGRGAPSSQES